jgi:hypothetical protein
MLFDEKKPRDENLVTQSLFNVYRLVSPAWMDIVDRMLWHGEVG